MRSLSRQPPRPRLRAARPCYPVAAGLGAAIAVAACGPLPPLSARTPSIAPPEEAPAQIAVVPTMPAAPSPDVDRDKPAPPPPPSDLLADMAAPKFAEDNLESMIGIGCGGGCPPAYVLETEHRDSGQVNARLKFCEQAARKHIPNLTGTLTVHARIDESGRARYVSVEASDDVPPIVAACVHKLVQTAVYSSKYNYARETGGQRKLGDQKD